jgi:hypothetical protein
VFLVDMKDYKEFNEVYNTFFPDPVKGERTHHLSNDCFFTPESFEFDPSNLCKRGWALYCDTGGLECNATLSSWF